MRGGLYSRSWHQEALGTVQSSLSPAVSKGHPESCPYPLVYLHAFPCFHALSPPTAAPPAYGPRAWFPLLTSPLFAQRVQKKGKRRDHTPPQGKEDPTLPPKGLQMLLMRGDQRDGDGKPHLPLLFPLLPTLLS